MNKGVKKVRLVEKWGINDVDYCITKHQIINGKNKIIWMCPYYRKWAAVLKRCFNVITQERQPTYKGCTVSEDWKYLSNFIKWVDSQPNRDWMNCELDKDFLFEGNKHYSPETVVFLETSLNIFTTSRSNYRGKYMIGVCLQRNVNKNPYHAQCSNPFNKGGSQHLGLFPTELEAHRAWQAKKHEYACMLADLQEDERVAKALRERYAPDKDWTKR